MHQRVTLCYPPWLVLPTACSRICCCECGSLRAKWLCSCIAMTNGSALGLHIFCRASLDQGSHAHTGTAMYVATIAASSLRLRFAPPPTELHGRSACSCCCQYLIYVCLLALPGLPAAPPLSLPPLPPMAHAPTLLKLLQ